MLPETIDDLLCLAGALPVAAPREHPPDLVLLADADGRIGFSDSGGTTDGPCLADRVAREVAAQLARAETCRVTVDTPAGTRLALAVQLRTSGARWFTACLVDPRTVDAAAGGEATTAALVCDALAHTALRHESQERELRARIEQLTAGHDALRVSYSRTLAEAIEEREERLREREAADEELRRLHACNKLILDSAGEGIVGLDREGRIVFVNPAGRRMVGWPPDAMIGQSLHAILQHTHVNGQKYDWADSPVRRTLHEGTSQRIANEVFWRQDGTSFSVEYLATPMFEGCEIVGAVLTFQDITERRLLEGQLIQAQKLESIGQLAAGIAHEINTPTQFVGDNLRFLEDAFADLHPLLVANAQLPEAAGGDRRSADQGLHDVAAAARATDLDYLITEIPEAIAQSLEGVNRVAKIVRSMKEFSHPGSDEMETVDLNKALESTLTVCRNEWKYVADVVTDFDPALPFVNCLPGACNQVFLNLIINAAHAIADKRNTETPSKGTITVSTRGDGDWVEIRVADTGTGIAEAYRAKVFDPFFTTKEVGRGTGQGLAIARSVLVDKHGGTLTFETEVGRGTTFVVRLPCRESESSRRDRSHA